MTLTCRWGLSIFFAVISGWVSVLTFITTLMTTLAQQPGDNTHTHIHTHRLVANTSIYTHFLYLALACLASGLLFLFSVLESLLQVTNQNSSVTWCRPLNHTRHTPYGKIVQWARIKRCSNQLLQDRYMRRRSWNNKIVSKSACRVSPALLAS